MTPGSGVRCILSAKLMQRRRLGRTSIEVSRLSLGCVTFGREIDQAASFAILDHALDAGINLLDTAQAYGGGESELILGRWLGERRCRDRVVVQTKILPPLNAQRVREAIDQSLRRLRSDFIDLLLFHAPDPQTPIGQSLEPVGDAIRAGKIRAAGCSNFSAGQLREALELADTSGVARLEVAQFNYNFAIRDAAGSLLPLCRERGVGVQTYSPLGAGFLTGKYRPAMTEMPAGSRFDLVPAHRDIYFHPVQFELVRRLRELSARTGISVPQLAVVWILKNEDVDTVLIGARTIDHVASAIAAVAVEFEAAWDTEKGARRL